MLIALQSLAWGSVSLVFQVNIYTSSNTSDFQPQLVKMWIRPVNFMLNLYENPQVSRKKFGIFMRLSQLGLFLISYTAKANHFGDGAY